MIVKDEAAVIGRCLRSVLPFIDCWVIVDTGSSDNTMEIVGDLLAEVPGEIHQRAWKDFAHNRNEAIELAERRADYLLLIDADEQFITEPDFEMPFLDADSYRTRHAGKNSETVFDRVQLVRTALPWRYVGVLHEAIVCDTAKTQELLPGVVCLGHFDSARNQLTAEEKYGRDAEVLRRALEEEPNNARYQFYLAQSLRDARRPQEAIAAYQKRAEMGGWEEEVWYSLYQIGLMQLDIGNVTEGVAKLLASYQARPIRAEPLYALARYYRGIKAWNLAYLFASNASAIERPTDRLFVTDSVYQWRANDERSISAYYVGRYRESLDLAESLLGGGYLPADQRARVEENRAFAAAKLGVD